MYEHRGKPLLPRGKFLSRVLSHALVALAVVIVSLGIGVLGYHELESLSWVDSLENAAMILGGMGPVNQLNTDTGKVFAASYALFAGIIFMVAMGIMAAPLLHRLIHRFHLDIKE